MCVCVCVRACVRAYSQSNTDMIYQPTKGDKDSQLTLIHRISLRERCVRACVRA